MSIGVVTVTYNSGTVLAPFLRSLASQSYRNFRLYAVDNASRDDSVELLKSWSDMRRTLILNQNNLGIAEGNNQGVRAALADGCDCVLFLNNDIEFEPETFQILIDEIETLRCDLLCPKILFADAVHIWSAGGSFYPHKGFLGFHFGEGEVDTGQYGTRRRVQHGPACCLLIRAGVFARIGMIDPKYFVYWDDTDFSYRAWRAGLSMYYTPYAQILHKVSSLTGGPTSEFTIRYNTRGHVYFMLKHLGWLRCLYYLPALEVRMFYKLLFRKIGFREFLVRQRAFMEGISVWVS